ncbi:hypothetical protein JL720_5750 [Aureococcus anophagefferens]|nr:hypothetical protein JL720_5750 [Aureococcus anophagefferens]
MRGRCVVQGSKDERDFRPASLKEIQEKKGYVPFKLVYHHSASTSTSCFLSCEDLGIIGSLFIVLWMCLLGIYTLLLKAALDTDEKSTALWIFFAFGVIFTLFVAGRGHERRDRAQERPTQEIGLG